MPRSREVGQVYMSTSKEVRSSQRSVSVCACLWSKELRSNQSSVCVRAGVLLWSREVRTNQRSEVKRLDEAGHATEFYM